jgi:hypothetical protein
MLRGMRCGDCARGICSAACAGLARWFGGVGGVRLQGFVGCARCWCRWRFVYGQAKQWVQRQLLQARYRAIVPSCYRGVHEGRWAGERPTMDAPKTLLAAPRSSSQRLLRGARRLPSPTVAPSRNGHDVERAAALPFCAHASPIGRTCG